MSSLSTGVDLQALASRAFEPLQAAIDTGDIPGAVLAVADRSGARAVEFSGNAQITPGKRAMSHDTWFDLASLTKVIFTTPRILQLAEQNRIDLDAPLCTVLQDLRQYDNDCWERQVTFRQCLGHQTPFPAVAPLYTYGQDAQLLRAFILQREWKKGPPVYSDINFILLGLVLERIAGKSIRQMDCAAGFSFAAEAEHCAATEHCSWRHRVICGEVHDDNCYALQGAGHAGLFGTAGSVLDFASGLLQGSAASAQCIELMRQPLSATHTHGWLRAHAGWSGGELCSEHTIGHTGFTGTGLWIDFAAGRAWTLLSNRIHPSRHADSGIDTLRREVGRLLYQTGP